MNEPAEKKEVRVWLSGFFDGTHFGHANVMRQARKLGDKLVVLLHNDEVAHAHKGQPVFTADERYRMIKAIRWVDEVHADVPYPPTVELLKDYNCDFCVHGDDISLTADGTDVLAAIKDSGMYKEVPRTLGISTTEIIGRLLLGTRANTLASSNRNGLSNGDSFSGGMSSCLSSGFISQFYENCRKPSPDDKIVYVAGAFDLFHIGHLAFLEAAAAQGTYLIVGIYKDNTVTAIKGPQRPLLSLHERVLCVLGYRVVDDVIIGASYEVTSEIIDHFKVDVVCHGTNTPVVVLDGKDPYAEAKKRGIYKEIDSGSDMVTDALLERIIKNRDIYFERNKKKIEKEANFGKV